MKESIIINNDINLVFNKIKESMVEDARKNGINKFKIKEGASYSKKISNGKVLVNVNVVIEKYDEPNIISSSLIQDKRKYTMNYILDDNKGKTRLLYEELIYENEKEVKGMVASFAYLLKRKELKNRLIEFKKVLESEV